MDGLDVELFCDAAWLLRGTGNLQIRFGHQIGGLANALQWACCLLYRADDFVRLDRPRGAAQCQSDQVASALPHPQPLSQRERGEKLVVPILRVLGPIPWAARGKKGSSRISGAGSGLTADWQDCVSFRGTLDSPVRVTPLPLGEGPGGEGRFRPRVQAKALTQSCPTGVSLRSTLDLPARVTPLPLGEGEGRAAFG